jgi:hypothetical protein
MRVVPWNTSIPAAWKRALELKALQRSKGGLWLAVAEENGRTWSLNFRSVQGWKVVAQECQSKALAAVPNDGALFLVEDSPWLAELGGSPLLRQTKHYVIFCYDEVVEVLAWECTIIPTPR